MNLELIKAILMLDEGQKMIFKNQKTLSKCVKRSSKASFLQCFVIFGLLYLVFDQEKRITKLEKIRVENLENEFENRENSVKNEDFDKEIDEDFA